MDPKHAGEMFKHLEKQHELLVDARQLMLDELHTYQIEEEMLMRKLNEVMSAHKKEADRSGSADGGSRDSGALVCTTGSGEVVDGSMREVAAAPSGTGGDVKKPTIIYTRRKKL